MGPSYLLCRLRVVFVFLGALVLYLPSTRDVDSHMKHDYTSVVRVSSMGPLSEDVFGCSTRRCILGSLHRQLQVCSLDDRGFPLKFLLSVACYIPIHVSRTKYISMPTPSVYALEVTQNQIWSTVRLSTELLSSAQIGR